MEDHNLLAGAFLALGTRARARLVSGFRKQNLFPEIVVYTHTHTHFVRQQLLRAWADGNVHGLSG